MDARFGAVVRTPLNRRRALCQLAAFGVSLPALTGLVGEGAAAQETPRPPDAPRRPAFNLPWRLGSDPYRWLENPEDPEVIAYLEAENAYTTAMMAPTEALQETLFQELT